MTRDFVIATPLDAVEFNDVYRNTTGSAGYKACNNIYSRLVLNEWYEVNPFPDLATHWEMLDGATRWRFHLNQAARWHDGKPVTAHDVAYTHTHAMEKGYTGGKFLSDVDKIVEVNDHTVDYYLKAPNSGFLVLLGNFVWTHILPAHLYEGTDWATNPHNLNPVGSGPFRFKEWIPGKHVILEAVENHWGPQPEIDRIVMLIEPDRAECVRMVNDGRADALPQDTLIKSRMDLVTSGPDKVQLLRNVGPGMALLAFNHRDPRFDNKRVREAIACAIDRTGLEPLADRGPSTVPGLPMSQPWPHYSLSTMEWSFEPNAKAPDHDVARAEQLLDEAGLTVREDGTRTDPVRLYWLSMFQAHQAISEVVAEQLGKVGIPVTVTEVSAQEWAAKVNGEHDFDMVVTGGSLTPELIISRPKYSSTGANNFGGHHNAEVDAAYERAGRAQTRSERAEAYRDLQRIWARDVEWVPLFWYGIYDLRSTRYFGYSDELGYSVPWWHWGRLRPTS